MWLTGTDGNRIAKFMGGTRVDTPEGILEVYEDRQFNRKIADFAHYVETCALAAGMTEAPAAYVLFEEAGLNAFAAGSGPGKSVVAITEGALLAFDRYELEGVVGHEIAHIKQGDTSYATKIIALCTALMILTEIGSLMMRIRSGRDNKLAAFGVIIGLTGILGTLFARLMQAYLSRQAEYRADAAGSLYAGTTRGLVSALKKIESTSTGAVESKIPQACAHMMLAPPGNTMSFSAKLVSLSFATHPPTQKRIAALEGEIIPQNNTQPQEEGSPFNS
jgi:Zn-dependent protease with chaperone function